VEKHLEGVPVWFKGYREQSQAWWINRRTVNRAHFGAALITLIVNAFFTFFGWYSFEAVADGYYVTVLKHGNCAKMNQINIALHLLINVVSTTLLWSSNYTTQILLSPSRLEITRTHEKGNYFDIGVPSVRNFWR